MNRTTLLLFLIGLFSFSSLWAQKKAVPQCATFPTDEAVQRLLANKNAIINNNGDSNPVTTYIPLQLHLVGDDDGNFRILEQSALREICNLNAEFAQLDMQFYLPNAFNYINDDDLNQHPFLGTLAINAFFTQKAPNAVNLFIVDQILPNWAGYYSNIGDFVVMDRDYMDSTNTVVAHELGHFFSLFHTFSGWEGASVQEGVPVSPTTPNGASTEYVDRTINCDSAGDFLCDTPSDYASFVWQAGCHFSLEHLDPDGEALDPDETNHMSYFYFSGCTDYQFSPEQSDIILADYQARTDLSSLPQPELVELDGVATLIGPIDEELVETYDYVELFWENVPGASGYIVEIFLNVLNTEIILERVVTADNSALFTSLESDRTHQWRVWAFNETEFCHNAWSETGVFKTGETTSTPTFESHISKSFSLAPNPVSKESFDISFQSESAGEAQVEIFDAAGSAVLLKKELSFLTGKNKFPIDISALANGLYFLVFKSDEEFFIERFLIHKSL